MDDTEVRDLAQRYFDALESDDHDGVVAAFTEDAFYSHPPYKEGGSRLEVRGHDGLREFLQERGSRPSRHEVEVVACHGAECFIAGVSRHGTPEPTLSFVSRAVVSDDGRFRSYIAYASRPPAGQW